MPSKVVVTFQVEDSAKWETGFRTRGELFRNMGITGITFAINDGNDVGVCFEVANKDRFLEVVATPEIEARMAEDSIRLDTVKVFAMDKEFQLS